MLQYVGKLLILEILHSATGFLSRILDSPFGRLGFAICFDSLYELPILEAVHVLEGLVPCFDRKRCPLLQQHNRNLSLTFFLSFVSAVFYLLFSVSLSLSKLYHKGKRVYACEHVVSVTSGHCRQDKKFVEKKNETNET